MDDAIEKLREFIDGRWAVVRRTSARFRECAELRVRLGEVTPCEATWFIESVSRHGDEPPLFTVEDDNKHVSDRYPPNADGSPRGNVFFEKSGERGSLRLETIVHQAAAWRLHDQFRWPRSHLIIESPDIVDEDQSPLLRREALDILVLEEHCAQLPSKLTLTAARSRVGVEAKADKETLDRLLDQMHDCQKRHISPDDPRHKDAHKKCAALDLLQPELFLGVAAGETWRLFTLDSRDGRAIFVDEVPTLDRLHFTP